MSNCNCDVCRVLNCQCEALKIFEGLYGPYFTPAIDENGNLSWTNNAGLPNPPTLNIMGTPGTGLEISGVVASAGDLPGSAEDWDCYLVGSAAPYTIYTYNPDSGWMSLGQLATGPKGDTGPYYSPSVSSSGVITWTNNGGLPNPEGVNIKGPAGNPGQDGVSPEVTVEEIPGGHRVTIMDADHPSGQTFNVMDGEDGGVTSVNGQTGAVVLDAEDVGAYSKPSGGIPSSDMASAVQTSLGKADSAYQKPSGGIPDTDLSSAVQTSLGKADSALQSVPNTYRTSADQDVIDGGKQAKITASGILKGDGSGGVSAAVAGTDYQAPLVAGTDYATPAMIPTVPSAATATPSDLGTAAVGSSAKYAREDHVHTKPTYSASDVGAVASNQGSGNAGKFLVVGNDGTVTPVTMTAWSGGNY